MENSLQIFQYLLKLSKSSNELYSLMNKHKKYFDISKDKMFSIISLKDFNQIVLADNCFDLILIEKDQVKSIYEFGAFDDSEFNIISNTFNEIKYKPTNKTIIIGISYSELSSNQNKNKPFVSNDYYHFERKKESRNEKVIELVFIKILFESFIEYKDNPDDKELIKRHLSLIYIEIYKKFKEKNWVKRFVNFELNVTDFEYDLIRNVLYLDFRGNFKYIDNITGKEKQNKYISIISKTKRLKTSDKLSILNCTIFKLMTDFVIFSDLFINPNIPIQLNNIANNGIPSEYKAKYKNIYAVTSWK